MFRDWLRRVLDDGESVQDRPPTLSNDDRGAVADVLEAAFDRHALDVGGPPLAFDPDAAVRAAVTLARACWAVAGGGAWGGVGADGLRGEPATAAAHLSADVTLRLLPAALRRARARGDERFAADLESLLRAWPLSGVLADLDGTPTSPPDFHGHAGLQLLYAERLVDAGRPGWVPVAGRGREWAERVFRERGRPVPAVPNLEAAGDGD